MRVEEIERKGVGVGKREEDRSVKRGKLERWGDGSC